MNLSQLDQLTQLKQSALQGYDHNSGQVQQFGSVQAIGNNGFIVKQHQGGTLLMQQAFSCAFSPEVHDEVSFIRSPNGQYYILNILARKQASSAKIQSPHGIEISTNESINLQSSDLSITNISTELNTTDSKVYSQNINVQADSSSFKARTMETLAERSLQKFKDSFRIIERIEQTSALDIIQNIKNVFLQRSKNTDISAKGDIKINGDRIHMG
jgi:ABC-type Na+ efflux pump permease subunit